MAFSLKSLLKRKGKGAAADDADDESPFAPGYEESPESTQSASGGRKRKKGKGKKSGSPLAFLAPVLAKLPVKLPFLKGTGGVGADGRDPFDNPDLLALIASELEALPPPEGTEEELFEANPVAEEADGLQMQPSSVDADELGADAGADGEDDLASLDEEDFLAGGPLGPDSADDAYRRLQRRRAITGFVAAAAALVVLALMGWWIWQPAEPDPWTSEGLTVLNEKGEPITIPPAEAVVSGWRVTMAMPPPPNAPLQKKSEGTSGALGTEKSSSRRPWLAEGSGSAPEGTSPDTPAEGGTTPPAPETETAALSPSGATPTDRPKVVDPMASLPLLTDPLQPGLRPAGGKPPNYATLPTPKGQPTPLAEAPDPDLAKRSPLGILPIIGKDGRTVWQAYARPFVMPASLPPTAPRISVIVGGLGMHPEATDAAIVKLPPEVTLAFSPYSPRLGDLMKKARDHGHEVLIEQPLEPENFPNQDPGPLGLLTVLPQTDNITRLETVMGKSVGYIGVLGRMGGKYGASKVHMRPILEALSHYGVMYVHTASSAGLDDMRGIAVPVVKSIVTVTERPFREAIDARLDYLVTVAKQRGTAVGVMDPSPLALDRLIAWMASLQGKGVVFTPVSAATGVPGG